MTTPNRWIVMTSKASMPSNCMGRYRNVALVKLTIDYAEKNQRPAMISDHAQGVQEVKHYGRHHVGKTKRSAYAIALADAEQEAVRLNASE